VGGAKKNCGANEDAPRGEENELQGKEEREPREERRVEFRIVFAVDQHVVIEICIMGDVVEVHFTDVCGLQQVRRRFAGYTVVQKHVHSLLTVTISRDSSLRRHSLFGDGA
jgi:hypothetical protein